MPKLVFVVTQKDAYEGASWVEGVFATRELAEAYIETQETELVLDGMAESYEFSIEKTFLVEK
jgi:hypothetical protein